MRLTQKLFIHFQVFWRAVAFGLGAYAVIRLAIYISKQAGLLDWLRP